MRHWREAHGLTLAQMAARISALPHRAGVWAISYLSRVERGEIEYKQSIVEAYCDVLGCTPGDLLSRAPRDPAEVYRSLIAELPGLGAELTPAAIERATRSLRPVRAPKRVKINGKKTKKPKG